MTDMQALTWQELFHLAVEMERQGAAFYLELAGRATDPRAAEVFRRLSAEENEHADLFRHIGLSEGQHTLAVEETAYLRALTGNRVFSAQEGALTDARRALGTAADVEKESILLYTELAALAMDDEAKKALSRVLRQEKLHLVEVRERIEESSLNP